MQTYTSAATSINSTKVPAIFNRMPKVAGTINIDIGGGKYDIATHYMHTYGIANYIYDPYNRTDAQNQLAMAKAGHGQADTATISNVLNVIDCADARLDVLRMAHAAVKKTGSVYITVYEGNGTGAAAATSKGWQANRKLQTYLDDVKKVFGHVRISNSMIIAKK